jgi:hypothetical protein
MDPKTYANLSATNRTISAGMITFIHKHEGMMEYIKLVPCLFMMIVRWVRLSGCKRRIFPTQAHSLMSSIQRSLHGYLYPVDRRKAATQPRDSYSDKEKNDFLLEWKEYSRLEVGCKLPSNLDYNLTNLNRQVEEVAICKKCLFLGVILNCSRIQKNWLLGPSSIFIFELLGSVISFIEYHQPSYFSVSPSLF